MHEFRLFAIRHRQQNIRIEMDLQISNTKIRFRMHENQIYVWR